MTTPELVSLQPGLWLAGQSSWFLVSRSPSSVEILDFGYPQNSETGALKTFITQQGIKSQVGEMSGKPGTV